MTPTSPMSAVSAPSVRTAKPEKGGGPSTASSSHARPGQRPPTGAVVRVLCVDDHAVLVEGLKAQFALEGHVEVVGSLPSADSLIEEVARLHPQVVLLDIEMPGADAFEMADRLHHLHPQVRVIILSAHVRESYLAAAFKAGACGYFAKSDDLAAIVDGVREVGSKPQGAFVMGPKVRERCLSLSPANDPGSPAGAAMHPPATRLAALTSRELEVLRLIGGGLSRSDIASQLSRSAKTIDGHQDRIMRKLGLDSRAELVRYAIREGLAEI